MKPNRLFRQVSLDRVSSPEQLDQLFRVTTLGSWIALAALALLIVVAAAWGATGRIPSKVQGQGMLQKSGGVFEVIPTRGGRVADLSVQVGDLVSEGQIVARLEQPDLSDRVQQARLSLENARIEHEHTARYGSKGVQLQVAHLEQQERSLELSIASAEESLRWLEERMRSQQQLADQGLITKQAALATRQQFEQTRERIRETRSQLLQIPVTRLQVLTQKEKEVQATRMRVESAETQLVQLERELKIAAEVVSPYSGRVLEVVIEQGNLVDRGESILTLDLLGKSVKELEAVVYVPSRDGKKLKPGMEVQISPSTVQPEEYGYMLGRVVQVSEFPATAKGMHRVLKNNELVRALSGGDAPYEVRVDLLLDPATVSRYRWSSAGGPPVTVLGGTLCQASITVDDRRPIEMVLPLLRYYTGL